MIPSLKQLASLFLMTLSLAVSTTGSARTLQQVLNEGRLQVGVVLTVPWAMRPEPGELLGFEVDVAKQLAEDMGVAVEFRTYSAERIVPALEAGEIDLIAAGLPISPQTALHVNFSQPYSTLGITMATNRDSTLLVEDLEDFDSPGYKITAVTGSAAAELIVRIFPRAELLEFETSELASDALVEGRADAYLDDEPIPTYLSLEYPATVDVPLTGPLQQSLSGFAINKGDSDFLAYLNAWITAKQAETWLPTIHSYWFQSLRWRQD